MPARFLVVLSCLLVTAAIAVTMLHAENARTGDASSDATSPTTTTSAPSNTPASSPADKRRVIKVTTATELAEAIGSDRVIEIDAESLLLDDARLTKPLKHAQIGFAHTWGGDAVSGYFTISRVRNLTIRGLGAKRVRLLAEPEAHVLRIAGCTNVELVNLELVHTEQTCSGACLVVSDCDQIVLRNCRLSGCGTIGLDAVSVSDIRVYDSELADCSEAGMLLHNCDNVVLRNCKIADNGGGIFLWDCTSMKLLDCDVTGNRGRRSLFEMTRTTGVRMEGGVISDNTYSKVSNDMVETKDVKIVGNTIQEDAAEEE